MQHALGGSNDLGGIPLEPLEHCRRIPPSIQDEQFQLVAVDDCPDVVDTEAEVLADDIESLDDPDDAAGPSCCISSWRRRLRWSSEGRSQSNKSHNRHCDWLIRAITIYLIG
jgi:hypothetical protein